MNSLLKIVDPLIVMTSHSNLNEMISFKEQLAEVITYLEQINAYKMFNKQQIENVYDPL